MSESLWETFSCAKDLSQLPAMKYGNKFEPAARDAFFQVFHEKLGHSNCNAKIKLFGLSISEEFPFLAASPDGLIICECLSSPVLIEIKCPMTAEHKKIHPTGLRSELILGRNRTWMRIFSSTAIINILCRCRCKWL